MENDEPPSSTADTLLDHASTFTLQDTSAPRVAPKGQAPPAYLPSPGVPPRKEIQVPAGQPTKYKPEYCEAVVEHMQDGASITSFAASINVCRATINVWMDYHPEFLDAVTRGKAKCLAWWEKTNRHLASTGTGNATACVFGLKNMGGEDWRDRKELDHTSSDRSMSPAGKSLDDFYDVPPEPSA